MIESAYWPWSALFVVEEEVKYWLKMSGHGQWVYPLCVCISVLPDLFELSSQDLQVVEGPSHSKHHLSVIAGSHADVPALRFLPFTH